MKILAKHILLSLNNIVMKDLKNVQHHVGGLWALMVVEQLQSHDPPTLNRELKLRNLLVLRLLCIYHKLISTHLVSLLCY